MNPDQTKRATCFHTARYLAALLLLIAINSAAAPQLSNGYTQHPDAFFRAGFWWDPADPGWGIDLHMSGDSLVAAWATYDDSGDSTWMLGVGVRRGNRWVLPLERFTMNDNQLSAPESAGSLVLTFDDNGYQATMDWTLAHRSGQRLIEPFVVSGEPIAEDRTGFWYHRDAPGRGMSIVTQGDLTMAVVFLYDGNGQPRWLWADNIANPDSTVLNAISLTGSCMDCAEVTALTASAGDLWLEFRSENDALMDADLRSETGAEWQARSANMTILSNRASGRAEPYQLVPFTNADTLKSYLVEGLLNPQHYHNPHGGVNFSPAPPSATQSSTTNLQESGVDEADLVKTDGQFVYAVDQPREGGRGSIVRVLEMASNTAALAELTHIEISERSGVISGLYLINDRGNDLPDLLVVTTDAVDYYSYDHWFASQAWRRAGSQLLIYDVDDPVSPELVSDIFIDGGAIETRRIGERLYHISRFQPVLPHFSSVAELLATLDSADVDILLPEITVNGESSALVDPNSTLLPPQPADYRYTDLITLTAISLDEIDAPVQTTTFAGFAEAIYVSQENIFISSSRYASSIDPGFHALTWPSELFTDIHQFALTPGGPQYRGSGVVEGFIAWGGISPSFSFSEHEGHLRVITSSGLFDYGNHRVNVLALPNEGQENLRMVGLAPNDRRPERLGKPGELLYGLRFLGDRLYAITFKKVDPLYVVDLGNPSDPKILGELEITGFSDYLHPLPGDLLLGFGKEASPAETRGDGAFAWYQGLQLSLFDVSDPFNPALIRRVDMGRRGSDSSLLYDHHAFSYLPPHQESGRPGRVAIPVVVHDASDPSEVDSDPRTHYPWRYTGLAMFDLTQSPTSGADLVLRDIATARSHESEPGHSYYVDSSPQAGRAIITQDDGYLYLRGEMFATPWGFGGQMAGPF